VVVLITCFAYVPVKLPRRDAALLTHIDSVTSQVFVVVAAGSVIAFIIRDLGDAELAGWIIQGPLLMQGVLSPILGRLSDITSKKYLAAFPPLIAFAGAVLSAKATSMHHLIAGGILIGCSLSTISIIQSIPSEILPLKYRALAQGFCGMGGTVGGLYDSLSLFPSVVIEDQ